MRPARGRPHVARAIRPAITVPDVDLVQGTHIVLPMRVTQGIYYVESPSDGRAVFVMPWRDATLVGTTETPFRGDPDQVRPLPEEEEYLLAVAAHYFPAVRAFTRADIVQRFAGLRVLPAASEKAFDRSRETIFTPDRDPHPRVLASTAANSRVGAPLLRTYWSESVLRWARSPGAPPRMSWY